MGVIGDLNVVVGRDPPLLPLSILKGFQTAGQFARPLIERQEAVMITVSELAAEALGSFLASDMNRSLGFISSTSDRTCSVRSAACAPLHREQ